MGDARRGAGVGETPTEGAAREETGIHCEIIGFASVWDSRLCGTVSRHHLCQFVFWERPLNARCPESPVHPQETLNMAWLAEPERPKNLDPGYASRFPYAFQVWRKAKRPYSDTYSPVFGKQ